MISLLESIFSIPLTVRYGMSLMSLGGFLISGVSGFALAYLTYRIETKFFSKNIKLGWIRKEDT